MSFLFLMTSGYSVTLAFFICSDNNGLRDVEVLFASDFANKKALLPEVFQGREHMLRVTTPNSLTPHDISLINYG